MVMGKKFIIIDGSSLVHRAFYALPLLQTAAGHYTNAVYGFTTMLVKLLEQMNPDYIAVAFDKSKVTFRNELYEAYKGQRKETPKELAEQFPLIKDLLHAFGICVLEEQGYEADDIIGTLSLKAEKEGHEVFIVTGDKDALQLISPFTTILLTKKGISDMESFDEEVFYQKYGIHSNQQIDLKGLMGDSSDNIPGVPGVGEKTALKLLVQYGNIESILKNIESISGNKLQEKLRENAELALLSKKLATIIRDMPIAYSLENFKLAPNKDKIRELAALFEFKSLQGKINDIFNGAKDMDVLPAQVELKTSIEELTVEQVEEWCTFVRESNVVEFFPIIEGKVPAIGIQGIAVWWNQSCGLILAESKAWEKVTVLLGDTTIRKVTHDGKQVFHAMKGAFKGFSFDTMLAAYLLDPTASEYSLETLQEKYMGTGKLVWSQDRYLYAGQAVKVVHHLFESFQQRLRDNQLEELYYGLELPLVEVLAFMENCGIHVDISCLHQMASEIGEKIEGLLKEIFILADEKFNVNSTKQLGVILFEKLKLPVIKKTKTGYSTDAEVLETLRGQHAIIDKLLEYRMLTKLKSTYLDGLEGLIHKDTSRLHTTFNQAVTATGRLSSSEPNLQNIPIRTESGRKIRELFTPGEGYDYVMSADYSQIELRILADMAKDENFIEAFAKNQDIHTRTAAEVFDIPMEQVTSEMRSRAKAVNFGIVYGISDYGLSKDIGVSRKEAGQYIDSYFSKYSGVKTFIENIVQEAHKEGYVTTLFGRRRYLPDINSSNFNQRSFAERTAMNTPIQGTAADIIKKAMLEVYRVLEQHNLRSRVLLQVHDELVLEVPQEEVEQVARLVKMAMEQCVNLSVPLVVDVKIGENWAKAK